MESNGFSVVMKSRNLPADSLNQFNDLIRDEFHAMNTYLWQSVVCSGWGHEQLAAKLREEAEEEMGHAELLMKRLTVFDLLPTIFGLKDVKICKDVKEMLDHNLELEEKALKNYNSALEVSRKHDDNGSRKVLEDILVDEEEHYDWLKTQIDRIDAVGLENYLNNLGVEEDTKEKEEEDDDE